MIVARTRAELAQATTELRGRARGIGLVPTMGALHAGHLRLLDHARPAGAVAASIFVNPTQFGPAEDFARYPRDEDADLAKLRAAGCDLVWLPDVATMYPPDDATAIEVAGPALGFEGAARPGHFRGVATVVAKLFGQVRPDIAVFGEKDWQQLQVIRRMVRDLALPVEIVAAPIVREADGLAMSSRNRYLAPAERARAAAIHRALLEVRARLGNGVADALAHGRASLTGAGFAVEYLALVDGETMVETRSVARGARLIVAAKLAGVRLLDNLEASDGQGALPPGPPLGPKGPRPHYFGTVTK